MLKTIIIFSIVILAYCADPTPKADCSKLDQLAKDADLGLKLSKIQAESKTLTQFSAELEQAAQGFKNTITFIKKLKDTYDHKKILLQVQSLADPVPKVAGNSPDKTYNQLATALSEIRAVSRIYPELEKAQHIFDTMRDDVNQFKKFAADLNIQQSQIDQHLRAQITYQDCKGSAYVLEPNIYESSSTSTEEEEAHNVQSKQTSGSPPQVNTKSKKGKESNSKDAKPAGHSKDAKSTKTNLGKHAPIGKQSGMHQSVKGHSKHKIAHENRQLINVQRKQ